jgi:uncharacterized protein Usg
MASRLSQVSADFQKQINGYGLTTAHILYRLPDYNNVLQTFVWQEYDMWPEFPTLHRFLDFWRREIEGPLHSVTVAHARLIKPSEFKFSNAMLQLH